MPTSDDDEFYQGVYNDLLSYCADAVGDIASDMLSPHGGLTDDKWKRKIAKARKAKVQDLHGWLADELYSDPDTIADLIGDKIHEACNGDETKIRQVCDYIVARSEVGQSKCTFARAARIVRGD